MNEKLKQLIESVLFQTEIDNLSPYLDLFNKLAAESVPEQLQQLFKLYNDWKPLAEKFLVYQGYHSVITAAPPKIASLEQSKSKIAKTLAKNEKTLEQSYALVYSIYRQAQEDQCTALAAPSQFSERRKLVVDLHAELIEERKRMSKDDVALRLYKNQKRRNEIISELRDKKFIEIDMHLQTIANNHQHQFNELSRLAKETDGLHHQLSEALSHSVESLIGSCNTDIIQQMRLLDDINRKLQTSDHIPEQTRNNAERDYNNAQDKQQFITNEEKQSGFAETWFNLYGIYDWATNPNYSKKMQDNTNCMNYYKLLHERTIKTQYIDQLKKHLAILQQISPTSVEKAEQQHVKLTEIVQETIKHLQLFDEQLTISPTEDPGQIYDLLTQNKLQLSEKLAHYRQGLDLFAEISAIDRDNQQLRTQNSYLQTTKQDFSPAEINKFEASVKQNEEKIKLLTANVDTCTVYLQVADDIVRQKEQLAKLAEELANQQKTYDNLAGLLAKDGYPDSQKAQLEALHKNFINIKTNLQTWYDQELAKEEEIINPEIPKPAITNAFHAQLTEQHHSILTRNTLPEYLQSWYQELYETLLAASSNETTFYQATQVLRDIHFELEFPNKEFRVLHRYYQLCKSPKTDYQNLLAIKPAVAIDDSKLDNLDNQTLQLRFDALYRHQQAMQKSHPREAQLLWQATRNLQRLALHAQTNLEQGIDTTVVGNLLVDPRYEDLHGHRGLLKAVEYLAQLCTSFLSFIGCAPESVGVYSQRFFYISPQSQQLLEATAMAVQDEKNFTVTV